MKTEPTTCNVRSEAERHAFYEALGKLKASCGSNKNDQADMLIIACIEAGRDQKSSIIGTLVRLDLNRGHVARRLDEGIGNLWRMDAEGEYRVLPFDS